MFDWKNWKRAYVQSGKTLVVVMSLLVLAYWVDAPQLYVLAVGAIVYGLIKASAEFYKNSGDDV